MKPIVVTTPRCGSELFCQMMGSVAEQHYGYKNTLHELFTITPLYRSRYRLVDGCIEVGLTERLGYRWFTSVREEKLKRLAWIKKDPSYLLKIFPVDLEPEIEDEVTKKYDIIYLERRDRLRQLISYYGMLQKNMAHYRVEKIENEVDFIKAHTIEQIRYNRKHTVAFLKVAMIYQEFKQTYPSKYPTVYYEDFVAEGANEQAIVKLLGLPIGVEVSDALTVPTPYKDSNPEDLIINQDEWLDYKPNIIRKLNNIYGTTQ
jgi:hypothetical protein